MPRLPQSKRESTKMYVRRQILAYKAERIADGIDYITVAAALGFTAGTFRNRINDIGKLTLDELLSVANTLNISVAALLGSESTKQGGQ